MSLEKMECGVNYTTETIRTNINGLIDQSVSGIKSLESLGLYDGMNVSVNGFYVDTTVGGGNFVYDASKDKADHNGGTIIAPEAIAAWDGSQVNLSQLLSWTGTGSGCFVKVKPENELGEFGQFYGGNDSVQLDKVYSGLIRVPYTPNGYRFSGGASLTNKELVGENYVTLKSFDGTGLFVMGSNATLDGFTIDGELSGSNRVEVGSASGVNNKVKNNIVKDCVGNSFRTALAGLGGIIVSDNDYTNSKLFNTNDFWLGSNVIIKNNFGRAIPSEGVLIDQPAVTPSYTGVIMSGNILESAANSSRCAGFARSVGTLSNGNIYKGNTGVDDLLHFEDKAEAHVSSGELFLGNGSARCIDGSLGGDITYTHADRQPKSILIASDLIKADGGDAIWFQGAEPLEHSKITLTSNHIESPNTPVSLRAKDGVVTNNAIYDAEKSINITKQSVGVANSSDTAHNVLVTNNYYVRPKFIRGDVGLCFDPNSIVFKTSFADSGAGLTFGGSAGGSVITYPVDSNGVKFMRITGGAAVSTRRIDLEWAVGAIDFQNLDTLSVQVMTRSSVQNIGKIQVIFPNAGVSLAEYRLNNRSTFGAFEIVGATKQAKLTNFYAAGAGLVQVRIWLGDSLGDGQTLDIAWIKVSHVSQY